LSPLGAVLEKKKEKRKRKKEKKFLSIASANRKHTDGEEVEQEPIASRFSM
jgi:hypothetical protein